MGVLIVFGYGPGISQATAERFGREGYSVALVGRNRERLAAGVELLSREGIEARAFRADASEISSIRSAVDDIRTQLGSPTALLWTAFRSGGVSDVLQTPPEEIERVFDVSIAGLLACVQAVLGDLTRSSGSAAILVANGALGEATSEADAYSRFLDNDGVSLENAAKTKLVGILAERLRADGVYVGEITIAGSVGGTATASPTAIPPATIADTFWSMATERTMTRIRIAE
ncbi:SDR family NAD(P)-dependent oxidoreductase [Leifsonia sp. C5G2]|uniref:SDR family NAD(P)-dependent oxidoreductase n=1 Tax=Leifsonia sp. C5G2 TaxID=2735269 RepID=UPI001584CE9E|nr:SDR family NAD(P)-dependent oxidoreductase [Leifsonia sp. C5G2]